MNNTTRLVALQLIKTAQAWDPTAQARTAQSKQQAQQSADAQRRAKATATGGKLVKDMTPAEKAQDDAEYKARLRATAQASGGHNAPAGDPGFWSQLWDGTKTFVKDSANLASLNSMRYLTGLTSGLMKVPGALIGGAAIPGGIAKGLWNYATSDDPNQGFFSAMKSGIADAYNTFNDGINNFDIGGYSINRGLKELDNMNRWAGNKYTAAVSDMTGLDPSDWNGAIRFSAGVSDRLNGLGELTGALIGAKGAGRVAGMVPKLSIPGRAGAITDLVAKPIAFGAGYGKYEPAWRVIERGATDVSNGLGSDAVRTSQKIKDQQMHNTNGLGINIYDYLPQSNQQSNQGSSSTQFQQPHQNQVSRYNTFSSQGIANNTYNNQHAQFGNQFGNQFGYA